MKHKFYFHYDRVLNRMYVNFDGQDYVVKDVECDVPVQTQRNLEYPRLKLVGEATDILIQGDKAIIYDN